MINSRNTKRSEKPKKRCGYCGVTDVALTQDHVIPKALWKESKLPLKMVTVPACVSCQLIWDKDTTYFRNMVVLQSSPDAHPAIERLAKGPIRRRVETSASDLLDITKNARVAWKKTKSGILIEKGIQIDFDFQRFIRTPEKIVRGLFFLKSKYPLPKDYHVIFSPNTEFINDDKLVSLINSMHDWQTPGDRVFRMRSIRDSKDMNVTAWLFVFYDSIVLLAVTLPLVTNEEHIKTIQE